MADNRYGNPMDNDEDDTAVASKSAASNLNPRPGNSFQGAPGLGGGEDLRGQSMGYGMGKTRGDGFNKSVPSVQSTAADGAKSEMNGAAARGLDYAKVRRDF